MIRLAGKAEAAGFLRAQSGFFAVKQLAMLEIYGEDCGFWLQGDGRGGILLSRLSGTVTLCGEAGAVRLPELAAFLKCTGRSAEGPEALIKRLRLPYTAVPVFAAPPAAYPPLPEGVRICVPEQLAPVYGLLAEGGKSFSECMEYDAWLVDFSSRCRRGHSQCFILEDRNNLAATFSILFQAAGQAVGGAYTVRPDCRGKGYGALLLAYAAASAAERGLRLLLAAEPELERYYLRRGWHICERAARTQIL